MPRATQGRRSSSWEHTLAPTKIQPFIRRPLISNRRVPGTARSVACGRPVLRRRPQPHNRTWQEPADGIADVWCPYERAHSSPQEKDPRGLDRRVRTSPRFNGPARGPVSAAADDAWGDAATGKVVVPGAAGVIGIIGIGVAGDAVRSGGADVRANCQRPRPHTMGRPIGARNCGSGPRCAHQQPRRRFRGPRDSPPRRGTHPARRTNRRERQEKTLDRALAASRGHGTATSGHVAAQVTALPSLVCWTVISPMALGPARQGRFQVFLATPPTKP